MKLVLFTQKLERRRSRGLDKIIQEKDVIIDENDQRKGNINKPIYIS